MFSEFPMCVKGYLYMNEGSVSDSNSNSWHKKYCVLLENDTKLYVFDDEGMEDQLKIPPHLSHFRMDKYFNRTNLYNSSNFLDGVSTLSSKNMDSDKYASNSSLTQSQMKFSKLPFFRNGSKLFSRAKSSSKINTYGKESIPDNTAQTKSVSSLKRSQSLNRVVRKKSEETSSKSPVEQLKSKNRSLAQSTGDLTAPSQSQSSAHHKDHKSSHNPPESGRSSRKKTNTGSSGKISTTSPTPLSIGNNFGCNTVIKVLSLSANHTYLQEVHPSLVDDRPFCFCVCSATTTVHCKSVSTSGDPDAPGELPSDSQYTRISDSTSTSTHVNLSSLFTSPNSHIFAARSSLEKQCWMRRIQQTSKPNLENESRLLNSLKLTISECKGLTSLKRKYFCCVYFDKAYFAKTTSKLSSDDGSLFWGEDFNFEKLYNFKNLTIYLYKEPDVNKEGKKKKKKSPQCIAQYQFNLSQLSSKNELQNWYHLKNQDILQSDSPFQMRILIKYQALKLLTKQAYQDLHYLTTNNYSHLISFLEKILPIKQKEEIARCLVNIHENNGTIAEFLNNLILDEIRDTDNLSMVLRANTITTKIIECYLRLIGSDYIYGLFHLLVRDVMSISLDDGESTEVDPQKIQFSTLDDKQKKIMDNQHRLLAFVRHTWNKIFESRYSNFPKQLKLVFNCWRKALVEKSILKSNGSNSNNLDAQINDNVDVIISGCLFLRLVCPAILSPHLFGLVSSYSEDLSVRRTFTLIAKSIQSLANFSRFGDKEDYMVFMNNYFDEEIPRMHAFLRTISSLDDDEDDSDIDDDYKNNNSELTNRCRLKKEAEMEIEYYGYVIDPSAELARLHNILSNESIAKHPKHHKSILELPGLLHTISQKLSSFCQNTTTSNSLIGGTGVGNSLVSGSGSSIKSSTMTSSAITHSVSNSLGITNSGQPTRKFGSSGLFNNSMSINNSDHQDSKTHSQQTTNLASQKRRKSSVVPNPDTLPVPTNQNQEEVFSEFPSGSNYRITPVDDYGQPLVSTNDETSSNDIEEDVWKLRQDFVQAPASNRAKDKYMSPPTASSGASPLTISYSMKPQYKPIQKAPPTSLFPSKVHHYHTGEETPHKITPNASGTVTKQPPQRGIAPSASTKQYTGTKKPMTTLQSKKTPIKTPPKTFSTLHYSKVIDPSPSDSPTPPTNLSDVLSGSQPPALPRKPTVPQSNKPKKPATQTPPQKSSQTIDRKSEGDNNSDSCIVCNPIYDMIDDATGEITKQGEHVVMISGNAGEIQGGDCIENYFSIRSQLKHLEEHVKQAEDSDFKNANLQDMYQKMQLIKLDVQTDQMRDLKRLKNYMTSTTGSPSTSKSFGSRSCCPSNPNLSTISNELGATRTASGSTVGKKSNKHHNHHSNRNSPHYSSNAAMSTTAELDEVINKMNQDKLDLEETQQNMRRRHNIPKSASSSLNPAQHSKSSSPSSSITDTTNYSTPQNRGVSPSTAADKSSRKLRNTNISDELSML